MSKRESFSRTARDRLASVFSVNPHPSEAAKKELAEVSEGERMSWGDTRI